MMAALRKLGTWLGVLVLWLIHFLPMKWIGAIGAALGSILYRFGRGRVTRARPRALLSGDERAATPTSA